MKIILSELIRLDRLMIVDEFDIKPKTKELAATMTRLNLENALFVPDEFHPNLSLAARNLVNADVKLCSELNPLILLKFDKVCMTVKSIHAIEEWLS